MIYFTMFLHDCGPSPRRSREMDHGRYNNLSFVRRACIRELTVVESGPEATRSWRLIFLNARRLQ